MPKKSTLYLYIKSDKGWRYCKPALGKNGKVIPQAAIVNGKTEIHEEGKYYLSLAGKWIPAGDKAADAVKRLQLMNAQLQYEAKGGMVSTSVAPVAPGDPQTASNVAKRNVTLADARTAYLAHIDLQVRSRKLKPRTLSNATQITAEFLAWLCKNTKVTKVSQITTAIVDEYIAWAIQASPTKSNRTGANKYIRVGQFLRQSGHPILSNKLAPRYSKDQPVRMYTPAELSKYFGECTPEQAAVYKTFLNSGMREMEQVYLQRPNVNPEKGTITICEKPEYDWTPKSWECREIQLSDEAMAVIVEHLKTHNHKLVFPTSSGLPNYKLLRTCKRIAKRAGLDESEWWLHAFRSTCATNWLRDGLDIPTVQKLLGHAPGSSSIWRYVRALENEQIKDKMNAIVAKKKAAA